MCGLFIYARVREARKKTGLGNFEFFWIFGKFWGGMNCFEFERERKIFGFLGNLSFWGFKRDVDHYMFFFKCNIY